MESIEEIISRTGTHYCVECRKCSSACPVTRVNKTFSPARIVELALFGFENEVSSTLNIWSCLGCAICTNLCPSGVNFLDFIKEVRKFAIVNGNNGLHAHEGIFSILAKMMANSKIKKKNDWIDDLKIANKGEVMYFVGCIPFFDIMFKNIDITPTDTARNTVKILNACGITPVVAQEEVCCGHDALWNGDEETFKKLAMKNVKMIKEKGIKKIIFSCPECYRTFKLDYACYFDFNVEMVHISEFIADAIAKKKISLKGKEIVATYHDPCRLGRHMGIYEEPRSVLKTIDGLELKEMDHTKENALCCGTSTWMACTSDSEKMRKERLEEVKMAGANVLITACPKCQIHFNCTLSNENMGIEVKDFVTLCGEQLEIP